ncbi:iron-containing alcohol dehydrogenase [Robertmurraya sp. DFI.2.37]|jgi:acetaldehyde dehydrogenase/alcohol dehydrogenase|uniref:1-propanol dehydrogenase PduQ n=1 Tax=Robertmurraya sp. DFI.2.37 TaxID=3031819 RepID=UPI0012483DC9|nr:1-propanol dehydrogenase PduQ [Robertmurraya sp. DFI.2.37]MDF1507155.1 iron-containing alcohol dehydrogenase [Robertmurraya sp. DFI.2.37]
MNSFFVGPKIYNGSDSINYLKELKARKVFLVTDQMMVKFGMADAITDRLQAGTCKIFAEVEPNPSLETVQNGLASFLEEKPDVLIALGGGSPIDVAKAILLFYEQIKDKMPSDKRVNKPLFIAIPTTSGTGSEVTSYSVVTDVDNNIKIPLNDSRMIPDVAILDEQLTKTVPPAVTADTGMDVLTHAIEAYVSSEATEFTDLYAEKAITIVFKYLLRAYRFGNDLEARGKLHLASCMAGIAFTNASLGITHSLAHAIGAKFHLSHGRSNALLLPYIIQYNGGLCDDTSQTSNAAKKYMELAKTLGLPCQTRKEAVISLSTAVKVLNEKLGIPQTIQAANIDEQSYERHLSEIVKSAQKDICTQGNPKEVTEADFVNLLKWIYKG